MSTPALEVDVAEMIYRGYVQGNNVYAAGNGGSCDQANHLCAELMGKFHDFRPPVCAHSLCSNPSTITAIANDYGFDEVFSRQVHSMAPGDILFLLSTSGDSANLVSAAEVAHDRDVTTIHIGGGGLLGKLCEYGFLFTGSTAQIQERTLGTIHTICRAVDEVFENER